MFIHTLSLMAFTALILIAAGADFASINSNGAFQTAELFPKSLGN